ncbi:type II toxin-antitoxin system mRNA interferase toxin, RelE/StbE family [Methanolacinia petrolearia]|uniref:type II toxin-antitoxin system mRNA interferase toxin, RelE/StbE family n=1 Tax=Methanolacinia petrolearia TaxID=54120 RepID=UPI003BAA77AD
MCLEEYLFVNINLCNKHELKGNCKGYWRLHIPYNYVAIYVIEGTKPDRHAIVLKIMTEKEYHNWIKSC